MEKNNTDDTQKLMENYNFDLPIPVTLVVEEDEKPNSFIIYHIDSSETTSIPTNDVGDILNQSQTKEIPIPENKRAYNKTPQQKNYFKRLPPTKDNSSKADTNALGEKVQEKWSDFPWHLLNPVIDNLIHISKFHYYNILNVNKQSPHYEKLKCQFLDFKNYFFNLSYSTTLTLLLPEEKNENFLLSFVERIIQIANTLSWNEISFERTYTLIRDLLCWTKWKQSHINKKYNYPNRATDVFAPAITSRLPHVDPDRNTQPLNINPLANNSNTPITNNLQQQSTHPFRLQSYQPMQGNNLFPNYFQPTTSTVNSPRQIPKYGHPTTNAVNNTRENSNILKPRTSTVNSPRQIPNYGHPTTSAVNNTIENSNILQPITSTVNSRRQIPNYGHPTTSAVNNTIENSNILQPITSTVNSRRQIPNYGHPTTSPVNNTRQIPNVRQPTARTVNTTKQIGVDPSIGNILNYQNATQTTVPTSVPQEYENYAKPPHKRRKTNDIHNLEECNTGAFQMSKDPVRSSISRDSGFGSPSYANFPDVDLNPIINQEEMIPIISHVTSTNPNAVNIKRGNCKVCQTVTNKVCMACYDQYYCSSVCQGLDWSSHQIFCKIND